MFWEVAELSAGERAGEEIQNGSRDCAIEAPLFKYGSHVPFLF